jgi:hypothetical protein
MGQVTWVLCPYGIARLQVAGGGDGLQIRRVAANILNKQSWTADKSWSSSYFYGKGNENHEFGTRFFVCKRIISAVKRDEFVSDRMPYIILRGR